MRAILIVGVLSAASCGCKSLLQPRAERALFATSYHHIAPISVHAPGITDDELNTFPQNEMGRFSMSQSAVTGRGSGAGTDATGASKSALIVTDFIKYRSWPLPVIVTKNTRSHGGTPERPVFTVYKVGEEKCAHADEEVIFRGAIPIYVGIGVRIQADVSDIQGEVNFSSLPGIAAAATMGKAKGTISVGTMGIKGNNIGLLIQQPVALNDFTVQSALQSVGAIKASLAAAAAEGGRSLQLRPQVVGFEWVEENPDARLTQAIRAHVVQTRFEIRNEAGYLIVAATPLRTEWNLSETFSYMAFPLGTARVHPPIPDDLPDNDPGDLN